jgi:hypothetical protein
MTNQQRQIARVIDVCVTHENGINCYGIEDGPLPIAEPKFFQPLKQATVEQDLAAVGANEVL